MNIYLPFRRPAVVNSHPGEGLHVLSLHVRPETDVCSIWSHLSLFVSGKLRTLLPEVHGGVQHMQTIIPNEGEG